MKRSFISIILLLSVTYGFAQSPQRMSYQCVVRNASGKLVASQSIGLRISILQESASGNVVYQETYNPRPQTNANGLVTVEIGGGEVLSGTFSDIDWGSGTYFLKTETDPTGGTNYTIAGTSQLLSVPYALHAKTAENGFSGNYEDLSNKPNLFSGNYDDLLNLPVLFDGSWVNLTGKPTFAAVATSGSYNDLTNRPVVFDGNYNSLINKPVLFDGNYNSLTNRPVLFDGTWTNLSGKPSFSAVATSGSYNDLSNRPVIFDGNYNSLINKPVIFDGTWSSLSGKPSFATVATSGSYNDLTSRPVIDRETTDEFLATAGQTTFTLKHTLSATSNLKMYINGIRISNSACSNSGITITYNPVNNGSYALMAGDRIQIDYSY
jgi:hypothetical protein